MESLHPYHNLEIPDDAAFELKPTPDKGWGIFATRDIEPGEIILIEQPLFVVPDLDLGRSLEDEIRELVEELHDDDKEQFFSLRRNGDAPFESLEEAFMSNRFTQSGTDYPGDEALLLLMSRFNHSCAPNAELPVSHRLHNVDPEDTYMLSMRAIPAGSEITFSYDMVVSFLTRDERGLALPFDCNCDACQVDDPDVVYVSDLRRTLLRGLDCLTNLRQARGSECVLETDPRHIIADPSLRAAAANFDIPHSSRFIYYLMMPCILEAEGILSVYNAETYDRNLRIYAKQFRTQRNALVARWVMELDGWANRFCVALGLWNRADAADQQLAACMRENFGFQDTGSSAGAPQDESVITPIIEEVD
ncbi:hypothetical protein PG993_011157 [Apiospora rasikravindrae]|uniref:SET domain-containing protein n=1 Tax=Apiospora rasikravindrae TaxID=990691 RepID=A0ABR1SDS2_9PEZI